MGEVLYEERRYPAGFWVSARSGEDLYEQSISLAFMKLMRFICKENSAGEAPPSHPSAGAPDDITASLWSQGATWA